MAHICVTTTKTVNLGQLSAEVGVLLGTGPVGLNQSGTSICYSQDPAPGTEAQLQQAITAHVVNPDHGIPPEELELRALQVSLDDLIARRKTTFQNNAERDRILALVGRIVLRMNGYG